MKGFGVVGAVLGNNVPAVGKNGLRPEPSAPKSYSKSLYSTSPISFSASVVVVVVVVVVVLPRLNLGLGLLINPGNLRVGVSLELSSVVVSSAFFSSGFLGLGLNRRLGELNRDDLDGRSVVVVSINASGAKVLI